MIPMSMRSGVISVPSLIRMSVRSGVISVLAVIPMSVRSGMISVLAVIPVSVRSGVISVLAVIIPVSTGAPMGLMVIIRGQRGVGRHLLGSVININRFSVMSFPDPSSEKSRLLSLTRMGTGSLWVWGQALWGCFFEMFDS